MLFVLLSLNELGVGSGRSGPLKRTQQHILARRTADSYLGCTLWARGFENVKGCVGCGSEVLCGLRHRQV